MSHEDEIFEESYGEDLTRQSFTIKGQPGKCSQQKKPFRLMLLRMIPDWTESKAYETGWQTRRVRKAVNMMGGLCEEVMRKERSSMK